MLSSVYKFNENLILNGFIELIYRIYLNKYIVLFFILNLIYIRTSILEYGLIFNNILNFKPKNQ